METKMNIKLTPANLPKIQAALDATQRRCSARCIDTDVITDYCERTFDSIAISKAAMDGVKISVDYCCQSFPHAYNGRPESTFFDAVYKRGAWYITNIYRDYTRSKGHEVHVTLTDAAKAAILRKNEILSI